MFPFGSRLTPPSRLPRPIPPFPGETTASYLYRLAVANQVQPGDLQAHLTGTRQSAPVALDALAAATGRSPHCLSCALPELRPGTAPGADSVLPAYVRRTVCWRCAARRGAFRFAAVWQPAEVTVCPSHRIWLGPPVRAQYHIGALPEILRAQRRHHRLARRHGRQATVSALAEAAHIIALWARHGFHRDRRIPFIRALTGDIPLTGRLQPGDPITPIVTYSETVDLARVLVMPHWRHRASPSSTNELRQFRHDIDHHVGIRYRPEDGRYDPLFRCSRNAANPLLTVLPYHGRTSPEMRRWLLEGDEPNDPGSRCFKSAPPA
jgi:hypothetical protein